MKVQLVRGSLVAVVGLMKSSVDLAAVRNCHNSLHEVHEVDHLKVAIG